MIKPLITIITAAHRLDGLKRVINCIDQQSYTNWEHVIVNDCSEDIRKELTELCSSNKRKWIDCGIRCHTYGGVARNIGIAVAFSYVRERDRDYDNEFLCFLDDDNLWSPNHLQSLIDILNDNQNASLIGSDFVWIGTKNTNWHETRKCELKQGGCDLGNFLYRRKMFFKYGFFNPRPNRKHKFDWEIISRIVSGEKNKIFFTNQPTFIMSYRKK